jgi:hypothetical protein
MIQGTHCCTSSALFSLIVRSRGLIKRWQDDSGNLLLHQFSPYFFLIDLVNEETPTPGYNRLQIKKYSYLLITIKGVETQNSLFRKNKPFPCLGLPTSR